MPKSERTLIWCHLVGSWVSGIGVIGYDMWPEQNHDKIVKAIWDSWYKFEQHQRSLKQATMRWITILAV